MRSIHRKIIVLIAVGVLIVGAIIGFGDSKSRKDNSKMNITYDIGHMVSGQFTDLGTLSFDDNNNGTLSLNSGGPHADRLKEAWAGISDKEILHIRRSERSTDADGDEVLELIGVDIERTSDAYPGGVMEYLSWKFGFFGVLVEDAE